MSDSHRGHIIRHFDDSIALNFSGYFSDISSECGDEKYRKGCVEGGESDNESGEEHLSTRLVIIASPLSCNGHKDKNKVDKSHTSMR